MKGILFKPDMIQAIIEGRKTQTRRLSGLEYINKDPDKWSEVKRISWRGWTFISPQGTRLAKPRYEIETVYVKEAWAAPKSLDEMSVKAISELATIWYKDGTVRRAAIDLTGRGKWRSPMIMPERFARYFLTITDVRAGRLRIITLGDAIAEGFTSVEEFLEAFIKINHLEEDANPWDFAYTFKQEMK